ncbi:hypothetical protein SRHO_G00307860 [Serrasalmus rhombeus]
MNYSRRRKPRRARGLASFSDRDWQEPGDVIATPAAGKPRVAQMRLTSGALGGSAALQARARAGMATTALLRLARATRVTWTPTSGGEKNAD